jgi:multidrug efflux pump subunit AcrA (membrane-fusion protein)
MYVLANVDESDIAPVEVGQTAKVNVAAMPRRPLDGEVVKIYPLGLEEQNVIRFQVKIHLKDPPQALRPGMTADATITVAERDDILKIPDVCIDRSGEDGPTVTVMTGEEQVEDRQVKIGLSNWDETEITSGLKEGEKVIIPPPPGSVLPRWMQSDDDEESKSQKRRRMLRNFR